MMRRIRITRLERREIKRGPDSAGKKKTVTLLFLSGISAKHRRPRDEQNIFLERVSVGGVPAKRGSRCVIRQPPHGPVQFSHWASEPKSFREDSPLNVPFNEEKSGP